MSTSSLNLAFFWHMHQPDYRDAKGIMKMPWVFLHAIKDYYEMPWLMSKYPGIKASFNITPPLIEQLNLYKEPLKYDYFLSLWIQEPKNLEVKERACLIKTCKSTQFETMVKPIEHFRELYEKESLSDTELIDFEVVFMLAWCGHALRQESTIVQELFKKERDYSQADKQLLLETLTQFIETILPLYASLFKSGTISLSTTPYNHPILPLLLNMQNAKLANEHTETVDNPLSLRGDAIEQIERSIRLFEETFGRSPDGFWPAEGAVDEESVLLYKERGIEWIATDEAILFASLQDESRDALYKPYDFQGVSIGFRDHGLSDLIGFNYRFKPAQDAKNHFIEMLHNIAKQESDATVFVILDGENAWEFFQNNAYDFFTTLYEGLLETPWCQTLTMYEASRLKTKGSLERLSPGSWIHGNFDTWSGHSEKNRAWELIYQTKRDFERHKEGLSKEHLNIIESHFLASECSDWFWWYGDDHTTEFGLEFDKLFREHLISIYELLNIHPPADLFIPIISHKSEVAFFQKPLSSITPLIDGKESSFFEWLGSGSIDESRLYSTMDRVRGPIQKINYGQDESNIYLAFEGDLVALKEHKHSFVVTIEELGETLHLNMGCDSQEDGLLCAIDERLEIELPKKLYKEFEELHLRFEILNGKEIIQTMPGFGALTIKLNENYASNWFV